jgi:hypothetical protein
MEKYPYFDKMSRINFWYPKSNGLVNLVVNYDALVKSQIRMAKKKVPNSRRANPE